MMIRAGIQKFSRSGRRRIILGGCDALTDTLWILSAVFAMTLRHSAGRYLIVVDLAGSIRMEHDNMDNDKDAIRELQHLYCFHMDEGRFTELAALFAADGEWIAPYRSVRGPAGIAAWLTQSVPASPRRMHYVMNSVIAVTGDAATAKSNYLVMVEGPDGPVPSVCGSYVDALVREPSGWRFRRRELIHAFKGEMRLTLPPANQD